VTRGLTPDVKLKPSGIEWLGEVPEHWEVVTLARLLAFGPKNGVSPPPASQNLQGAISFSISAIRDGKVIIKGNEKQVTLAHAFVSRFQVCHGDVLLVRGNGNLDFVARCGLVTECPANTVYPDIIIKIRSNEQIAAELLVHAINSKYVRSQVACVAKTTNGAHKISGGTLSALKLLVPPVSEQQPLLDWIASSVGTLDRACHVGSNHIDLIREYHARLVSDVVTGQLDIREVARQLPDEIARSSNDFDLDDANEDAESDLEPSEVEADV